MLNRTTRRKLAAFLVVTVLTLSTVAISYMRLPRQLGMGTFEVELQLASAAGLYPASVVYYRGVEVGTVKELEIADSGITARLAIDEDVSIPSDLVAEVHSASAIGEQYVDLVPVAGTSADALEEGSVIPVDRTRLPVATSDLLDNVNALVRSIPQQDLRTTVDELHRGLSGKTSDDLGRLLDSAVLFQEAADADIEPTMDLIGSLLPVLRTQQKASGEIASYTEDLARFSGELASVDTTLRETLQKAGPLNDALEETYAALAPTLPVLLADLATTARVAQAYIPGLEHTLIVFPAVVAAAQGVVPASRFDDAMTLGNLDFKTSINNPPVCIDGFADADSHRDPHDPTRVAAPTDSYCKVAPGDPRVVRGARNLPCPNDPARHGPKASSCGLVFDRVRVPLSRTALTSMAAYDPATGLVLGPDGKTYRLADLALDGARPQTWQELLRQAITP